MEQNKIINPQTNLLDKLKVPILFGTIITTAVLAIGYGSHNNVSSIFSDENFIAKFTNNEVYRANNDFIICSSKDKMCNIVIKGKDNFGLFRHSPNEVCNNDYTDCAVQFDENVNIKYSNFEKKLLVDLGDLKSRNYF